MSASPLEFSSMVVVPLSWVLSALVILIVVIVSFCFLVANTRLQGSNTKPHRREIQDDKDTPLSPTNQNFPRSTSSNRMKEEEKKKYSSEYTRRGLLWSRHASWHLPKAPRDTLRNKLESQYDQV